MEMRSRAEPVASENDSEGGGFGELRYESNVRAEYLVQTR
jgi:hypothetical protein